MLRYKRKKAIKYLNTLKAELVLIDDRNQGNIWKSKLQDTLIKYIGSGSPMVKQLDGLYFTTAVSKPSYSNTWTDTTSKKHIFEPKKREIFGQLIDGVINHINSHGLYKEPSTNFLSKLENWQLLCSIGLPILALLAGVFSWGNTVGKSSNEQELVEKTKRIDELDRRLRKHNSEDSIFKLKTIRVSDSLRQSTAQKK